MFELVDLTKNKQYKKQVKALYKSAFPANERPPFDMLWRRALKGKGEFFAAINDNVFAGLAHTVTYGDVVYLFYLAVEEDMRGKGIGSKILTEIKSIYVGKRIILNIEELDKKSKNYAERIRRKAFYKRNGFALTGILNSEAGVRYELMSFGGAVTYDDYGRLMKNYVGKFAYKLIYKQIN